jgi:predicted amidophosphoribosyltransferase
MLAKKYCSECKKKRNLLERMTDTDRDMCEHCYQNFVIDFKEKSNKGNSEVKNDRNN